jgi:ubiquinone/menaquinone biosynthesis C-methylase UbiE
MGSERYFDRVAEDWDQMRAGFFSDAVRERAIEAAGVHPGQTAADVGAGTGFITEGLVRRGLRVISIDPSDAMLDVMRKKFADRSGIDYRIGQAGRLPLADGAVDCAFANMVLHHADHPDRAIQEMVRIIKTGGVLVITDLDAHHYEFLKAEHHDRWMGFRREDVRRWMSGAGLTAVSVEDANETCCAQSACGSERASVSIFVASGRK